MGPNYAISFVCWFVMASMLAIIAPHFGDSPGTIFAVGMHMWLGFSATVGLTNNRFFEQAVELMADRRRLPGGVDRDHGGGAGVVDVGDR